MKDARYDDSAQSLNLFSFFSVLSFEKFEMGKKINALTARCREILAQAVREYQEQRGKTALRHEANALWRVLHVHQNVISAC